MSVVRAFGIVIGSIVSLALGYLVLLGMVVVTERAGVDGSNMGLLVFTAILFVAVIFGSVIDIKYGLNGCGRTRRGER